MKHANSFNLFHLPVCNLRYNLQLVKGGQYLVEVEDNIFSLIYNLHDNESFII